MSDYKTLMLSDRAEDIETAAELLRNGEVVAIPTETVYGLAADAMNEHAVEKIFEAKGRPSDNPLIVHISDIKMLSQLVSEIPANALRCAEKFWPGPLTMVMPKGDKVPSVTSGGLETVGVRFPSHKTAQKIISACGRPLAAPSANISGSPSPTTAKHVLDDMNERIPAIVDGGDCDVGVESTVICFEGEAIRLLRPGFVSVQQLREITENVIIDKGVLESIGEAERAKSPGMKYKHYSPKAQVYIIKGDTESIDKYFSAYAEDGDIAVLSGDQEISCDIPVIHYGSSSEEQAHRLFSVLRRCDELSAVRVFVQCPDTEGVGLAVYNRLLRAAAFRIIEL